MPVSQRNQKALQFFTSTYEADSKLTVEDRQTLLGFFESVNLNAFVATVSLAAGAGVGTAAICSRLFPKKPLYKFAPPIVTGILVSELARSPAEVFFFDKKIEELKTNQHCYNAAKLYRYFPVQDQIKYYQATIDHPQARMTDPRLLGDGEFDRFVNGYRDLRGEKYKECYIHFKNLIKT